MRPSLSTSVRRIGNSLIWTVRQRRRAGRSRRGTAAALVCLLVLALVPASSVVAPNGSANPVSWLASRLTALKDTLSGNGPKERQGELRAGAGWTPPGRTALVAQEKPKPPGKRVKEITRSHTATRTVYQLEDGRLQTELSSVPVRYRDGSGAWRDIDTRVVPVRDGGYRYGNDATGFSTRFGERSDALLRVQLGDRWLTVGVAGPVRQVTPTVKGSTVTYAGLWAGADLVYDITPSGVKESIVLATAPAVPSFDFTLRTAGLTTRTQPDGSVGFFATGKDATGRAVFTFPKPFMIDARRDAASPHGHAYSDKVGLSSTGSDATGTISLTPDQAWLAAKDRRYPVVLDPTIAVQPDVATAKDAMIVSYGATSNYEGDPRLGVGVDQWGRVRSLLAFDLTGIVPAGTPVDAADLSLYWDNNVLGSTSATPVALEARAVTQAWAPSTVTWNSINAAAGDLAGTATYNSGATNSWTSFPVTGTVREWMAGTRPNYGFMLKAANEAQVAGGPIFWAGEFPVAPAGEWPTYTTRTAPKLTLTFGLPAVTLADVQTVVERLSG